MDGPSSYLPIWERASARCAGIESVLAVRSFFAGRLAISGIRELLVLGTTALLVRDAVRLSQMRACRATQESPTRPSMIPATRMKCDGERGNPSTVEGVGSISSDGAQVM